MDYIQLYLNKYQEEASHYMNFVKNELIKYAQLKRTYLNAIDNVRTTYNFNYGTTVIQEGKLDDLVRLFERRTDHFQEEYEMEIIPQMLLSKFEEKELCKYSFRDFIIDLARLNARIKVSSQFGSLRMFIGGNFTKKKLEQFEWNLNPYKNPPIATKNSNYKAHTAIKSSNRLVIKQKFRDVFQHEDLYYHFTDYYIYDQEISFEGFKNIFTKEFKEHNSEIRFICDTTLAALLLHRLRVEVFENVKAQTIEASKKFKSKNGVYLTRSNISQSKNNPSIDNLNRVKETIELIHSLTD